MIMIGKIVIVWILFGLLMYALYLASNGFDDAEALKKWPSRKQRIYFRLSLILFWPIWLPILIIFGMIFYLYKGIISIFK